MGRGRPSFSNSVAEFLPSMTSRADNDENDDDDDAINDIERKRYIYKQCEERM